MMHEKNKQQEPVSDLTDSFLFQLVRLRKVMVRRGQQLMQEAGVDLKVDQIPVLLVLSKHPGLSQREIAEIIMRDKSSVLRSISSLLKRKLLAVTQDEHDKRKSNIALSSEGMELAFKIRQLMIAAEDDVLSVFTPKERAAALNNLKTYADILERN